MEQHLDDDYNYDCDDYDCDYDDNAEAGPVEVNLDHHFGIIMRVIVIILSVIMMIMILTMIIFIVILMIIVVITMIIKTDRPQSLNSRRSIVAEEEEGNEDEAAESRDKQLPR